MSTLNSIPINQSSSTSSSLQIDPTTLAISLIPLLPTHLSRESSDNRNLDPITLPLLAASLSTLPYNVINAVNCLAQELKSLREQQVLTSVGDSKNHIPSIDALDQDHEGENREKWLENQKVNHLKKSISSLTNLQSSLQARLLTTVDTLSDLQLTHKRETQQLADERDGVRAVNQVLKRKIATLDGQLRDSKDLIESVLERVNVVSKGDWSIIEHGVIQVHSPILLANGSNPTLVHDSNTLHDELCSFHRNHPAINPSQAQKGSFDHLGHVKDLPISISKSDIPILNRSTASDSNNRTNQRSLTLIVELTEELESLRQEIKVELKSKHDEIQRLKSLIDYRDEEIRQLMSRLEHFMGLDGFYVRPLEDQRVKIDIPHRNSTADLEATPRQRLDRHQRDMDHDACPNSFRNLSSTSPKSQTSEEQRLQEEIKQLETHLKEITQSSLYISPHDSRTNPNISRHNDDPEKSRPTDRSSLISVGVSDDQALSRVLSDLSNQVTNLKCALKEVSRERDALKQLRSRSKNKNLDFSSSSSVSQSDLGESSGRQTTRVLRNALERSQSECNRLSRLLAQSESRTLELQRQIAEQEAEFERVAERVQEKLKDQRSKLIQAQTRIEHLQTEVDQARANEQTIRAQLTDERKRSEVLMGIVDRKKNSTKHEQRLDRKKDPQHSGHSDGFLVSSSSSSASVGSSRRSHQPKDPFNVPQDPS